MRWKDDKEEQHNNNLCLSTVPEIVKGFRQEKLSTLRPLSEFFDHQRISRPADLNEATQVRMPFCTLSLYHLCSDKPKMIVFDWQNSASHTIPGTFLEITSSSFCFWLYMDCESESCLWALLWCYLKLNITLASLPMGQSHKSTFARGCHILGRRIHADQQVCTRANYANWYLYHYSARSLYRSLLHWWVSALEFLKYQRRDPLM